MLPKLILHNSITLNGSLVGFEFDLDLHYGVAHQFGADAFLVGSNTVLSVADNAPPDEGKDFQKPAPDDPRPYWVVVDSKGRLEKLLPAFRTMPYIKDIIVLIAENTPQAYVNFLEEKDFEIIKTGKNYVEFPKAFELLAADYQIRTILADSGSMLTNVLLKLGLIDEISLLIGPTLQSDVFKRIFGQLKLEKDYPLQLKEAKVMEKDYLWLHYEIKKNI